MQLRKILVPIDFSPAGQSVVDCASKLAAGADAAVIFVHVTVPPAEFAAAPQSAEGLPYSLPSQHDPGAGELDQVRPTAEKVPYSHELLAGDPAEQVVALASRAEVDLIVMGSHGHTALARLLLGSVAEAVVRRAHCPVLILRLPAAGKPIGD